MQVTVVQVTVVQVTVVQLTSSLFYSRVHQKVSVSLEDDVGFSPNAIIQFCESKIMPRRVEKIIGSKAGDVLGVEAGEEEGEITESPQAREREGAGA